LVLRRSTKGTKMEENGLKTSYNKKFMNPHK
jgi:hypothetical protein